MSLASSQAVSASLSFNHSRSRVPMLLLGLISLVSQACAQTDPGAVDLSHRASARAWHNRWWPKTYGADMGYTGDVERGIAGDVSKAWRDQCLLRINMLRRMSGCQPIVFSDYYNQIDQQAALMFSANNKLSHGPDSSWKYYSAEGLYAAESSSIDLGACGPRAVLDYLFDPGPQNYDTGHRFGMLAPAMLISGWGDVPYVDARINSANAFFENDPSFFGPLNYERPILAWPCAGYVPYYLIAGRWGIVVSELGRGTQSITFIDSKLAITCNGTELAIGYLRTSSRGLGIGWTLDGTSEGDTYYDFHYINGETIRSESRYGMDQDTLFHIKISGVRYAVLDDSGVDLGTGGLYNGTGIIEYDVIVYNPDLPDLVITTQPQSQSASLGASSLLYIQAQNAVSYQWSHAGVAIAGANGPALLLSQLQAADFGEYSVKVVGKAGDVVTSQVATLSQAAPTSALANISTRAQIGTGDQVLIAGLVIDGSQPKSVLLRGSGPSLATLGLTDVLQDPQLSLFDASGTLLASNDNWSDDPVQGGVISAAADHVGAFPWAKGSRDAAILVTLNPGAYTVIEQGVNQAIGLGLVEAYAVGDTGATRLLNLSARSLTKAGDKLTIAGFVITGTASRTVLLRCSGPGLTKLGVSGVMADPVLTLYKGSSPIASNDDWGTDASAASAIAAAAKQVGAFEWAAGSADAALLLTLAPGTYTAMGQGKGNASGVTLLEVYEVK